MHFGFRELVAAVSGAAVIFSCSCEKHRLGEDPEAQKERMNVERASEEKPSAAKESSPAEASTSPKETASPTPVEFFPEGSPTP